MPQNLIGWCILPFGLAATVWVLFKKNKRESFSYYIGLGIIWTIMAIVLDYFFIVKMLESLNYYKLDVYVYYILTLFLPILVGWRKNKQ